MKRLLFILFLLPVVAFAQGYPAQAVLPVQIGGAPAGDSNYVFMSNQYGRGEFRHKSTLFGSGNFINNQYQTRQVARAWIDTLRTSLLRADSLKLGYWAGYDTAGKLPLIMNANAAQVFRLIDTYPHKGLSNSHNNYNWAGPMFDVQSVATSATNFRRGPLLNIYKKFTGKTGTTVWGSTNQVYAEQLAQYINEFVLDSGQHTFYSDEDYPLTAGMYYNRFGSRTNNVKDTVTMNFGVNPERGPSSVFARTDLVPYNTNQTFRVKGWLSAFLSFHEIGGNQYSYIENLVDYAAGQTGFFGSFPANGVRNKAAFFVWPQKTSQMSRSWAFLAPGTSDNSYLGGKLMIGDSSLLNADVHKLYVNGSTKLNGNLFVSTTMPNTISVGDSMMVRGSNGQTKVRVIPTGDGGGGSYTFSNEFVNSSGAISINQISSSKITGLNSANWNAAYNDKIVSASVSGTTDKVLTLTQQDGGTVTAPFTDLSGSGSGEANTASNLGSGYAVFKNKYGVDLKFRSIKASTGIEVAYSSDDNSIEISAPPANAIPTTSGVGVRVDDTGTEYQVNNKAYDVYEKASLSTNGFIGGTIASITLPADNLFGSIEVDLLVVDENNSAMNAWHIIKPFRQVSGTVTFDGTIQVGTAITNLGSAVYAVEPIGSNNISIIASSSNNVDKYWKCVYKVHYYKFAAN